MGPTNWGLAEHAKSWLGRPYWYGVKCQPCTEALLQSKRRQYPRHYTDGRMAAYRKHIAASLMATDCSGLIQGYVQALQNQRERHVPARGWEGRHTDAARSRRGSSMEGWPHRGLRWQRLGDRGARLPLRSGQDAGGSAGLDRLVLLPVHSIRGCRRCRAGILRAGRPHAVPWKSRRRCQGAPATARRSGVCRRGGRRVWRGGRSRRKGIPAGFSVGDGWHRRADNDRRVVVGG